MLQERKDLEGPKPHCAWMTTEMYCSQRQEKKPTKLYKDLRKQDSLKKKNNQKVILCRFCV